MTLQGDGLCKIDNSSVTIISEKIKRMAFTHRLFCHACILLLLVSEMNTTLSKRDKKKKAKDSDKVVEYKPSKVGPIEKSVHAKSLVIGEELVAKDILENHSGYFKDTSVKNFAGSVLGYVTPWNSHGYDVAKTFGSKFSLISPVWLQVNNISTQNLCTKTLKWH